MEFVKSPQIEQFFDRNGIPYRFVEDFPFTKIRLKKSLHNNARILTAAYMPEVVEQYSAAMVDGDNFPAPVIHKNGDGYLVGDGNQRCNAYKISGLADSKPRISAYVIDTDDSYLVDLATRKLNRMNGVPQSKAEAIEQALQMLDKHPSASLAEVARAWQISGQSLRNAQNAREAESLLKDRKVRTTQLPRGVLCQLARLKNFEPVMAVAAELAINYGLTEAHMKEVVNACKAERSESKKLAKIEEFDEMYEKSRPKCGQKSKSPKTTFLRLFNGLYHFVMTHPTFEHMHITEKHEKQGIVEAWETLKKKMDDAVE